MMSYQIIMAQITTHINLQSSLSTESSTCSSAQVAGQNPVCSSNIPLTCGQKTQAITHKLIYVNALILQCIFYNRMFMLCRYILSMQIGSVAIIEKKKFINLLGQPGGKAIICFHVIKPYQKEFYDTLTCDNFESFLTCFSLHRLSSGSLMIRLNVSPCAELL